MACSRFSNLNVAHERHAEVARKHRPELEHRLLGRGSRRATGRKKHNMGVPVQEDRSILAPSLPM